MKMTIHLLQHLPSDVYYHGWIQSHWMFIFESLNGTIKGLVKDTKANINREERIFERTEFELSKFRHFPSEKPGNCSNKNT